MSAVLFVKEYERGSLWRRGNCLESSHQLTYPVSNHNQTDNIMKKFYGSFYYPDTTDAINGIGYSSDDEQVSGYGNDILNGNSGNDTLVANNGNDTLYGGYGDDILYGGEGNDALYGSYSGGSFPGPGGNNQLYGGGGDDHIEDASGDDYIEGGDGDDTILDYSGGYDIVYGGAGNDRIIASGVGYLDGGDNDDIITTFGRSAVGGNGNDTIYGWTYDDNLWGGEGDDTLFGGPASDFYTGGLNYLYGEGGSDTLYGDTGKDTLRGGSGNDTLYGAQDDDVLDAGTENDTLNGGSGNDTLNGGSGYDIATYSGPYTSYSATFASNGDVQVAGGEGADRLNSIERINFANGFYNVYTGDDANNTLTADLNVWSLLYGGNGNDTLTGGNGNDTLYGASGNDVLSGGNGNDYLYGYSQVNTTAAEQDVLTSGGGSDLFVLSERGRVFYAQSGNTDRALITYFDAKANESDTVFDRIQIAGNASQYRLRFSSLNGIGSSAQDTEILFNKNNTWERIGIVQDSTNLSFGRDFVFS